MSPPSANTKTSGDAAAAAPDAPDGQGGGSLFKAVTGGKRSHHKAAGPKAPRAPKAPPRPTPPKQRRGMEQSFTLIYGLAGAGIEQRGVRYLKDHGRGPEPTWAPSLAGRAMKLQSPMAGKELSDWVNSIGWLSAILGPVLGNEGFNTMAKVVGLPLMMHVLQVRPEAAPMIQPLVMPMLTDLYVSLKREQAKQTAAMEALSDMDENSRDEFAAWADSIFTVSEVVVPVGPEPAAGEPVEAPVPEPARPGAPVSDDGFGQIDAELSGVG